MIASAKRHITVRQVVLAACEVFNVTPEAVVGQSRLARLVAARACAAEVCRAITSASFADIAAEVRGSRSKHVAVIDSAARWRKHIKAGAFPPAMRSAIPTTQTPNELEARVTRRAREIAAGAASIEERAIQAARGGAVAEGEAPRTPGVELRGPAPAIELTDMSDVEALDWLSAVCSAAFAGRATISPVHLEWCLLHLRRFIRRPKPDEVELAAEAFAEVLLAENGVWNKIDEEERQSYRAAAAEALACVRIEREAVGGAD